MWFAFGPLHHPAVDYFPMTARPIDGKTMNKAWNTNTYRDTHNPKWLLFMGFGKKNKLFFEDLKNLTRV